jgi:hypothetical protein
MAVTFGNIQLCSAGTVCQDYFLSLACIQTALSHHNPPTPPPITHAERREARNKWPNPQLDRKREREVHHVD